MIGRLAGRLGFCLACLGMQFSAVVFAQMPDDWQVLRIFVPEVDVGSLVPNDYNPVEIEDLAEALAREATRRTQLQSTPHISDALYVVRCNAESLLSDQSRWSVKSSRSNATLKLEEISVALRNSGVTPADEKPLTPSLRYSTDGTVTLSKITGDSNYWFGMSAVPTTTSSNQSIYDLRLPAATLARMLVSAPESIRISSPDVIITPVSNPRDYLPENWPSLATAEGLRWYVIHLSGKSKFRLITEVTERNDALVYQHYLRRTSLVYSASETGLALSADFEIERLSAASSFKLLLDKALRVRSVTINGAAADYQAIKNSNDQSALEVVFNNASASNARLRIEALAESSFPFEGVLPTIEIERAFSLEGKTSLLAEDDLVGDQLVLASRIESAKPRLETTTIGQRWVADWIGVQPTLRASISRVASSCQTDSFTRLTIQEDWISATTNLRIVCNSLESNELRLSIGDGWFVDDLTIEKSDLPITTHLPDGEAGDVVLTWERLKGDMSISLQLVAHLPKPTNAEQFSLEAPRVVSVLEGTQTDHYAIEQTGRFQIEANPNLQRLQLKEDELLPWQSQLLSKLNHTQLFQGIDARIPPLVINRSTGTYTAKVVTIARPLNGHLQATYSIEVQPTSGAIDSATCVLTLPQGVDIPNWRITRVQDGEQVTVAKAIMDATRDIVEANSKSQVRFDLQLPDATSSKFVLQCELPLPIQESADVHLPLVTMPVATETWMILPRNLELPSSSVGIVALPVSVCCDSSEFARSFDKEVEAMVGYRYDSSIVSSVDLRLTPLKPGRGGWIWSDAVKHRVYNDGNVAHQIDLQMFAPETMTLVATLPGEWLLDRIMLDGVALESGQQTDQDRVLIQIPRGKNIHLSLTASSHRAPLDWFASVRLPRPAFSLASLNSVESIELQPGRISVSEIFRADSLSILDRLNPVRWWQWLDPSPRDSLLNQLNFEGWREVAFNRDVLASHLARSTSTDMSADMTSAESISNQTLSKVAISEIRLVDRSSLCAMCVAILLTGASLSFWLLGDRVPIWWFALTLSVVTVLIVPSAYVGAAHLNLLCIVGGALARLVRVVTIARDQGSTTRRGSTLIRAGSNATLALVILCSGGTCGAQETAQVKTIGKSPITYGVLIPVNEDGELSAKHVYASRKLMNLLNNSESRDSEEQTPQILGAKYMLKISAGTSLTASYVQEFTAEFDLQFNSTEFPLRLPFKANQLQLLRGSVSGQGVFIGPRLQQTSDAITYRPPETGRVRLRLQLIPATNGNVDLTGIEVEIPRIASSVLEVVADDSLDVNIKSIGLVRRLTTSSWSAELGPTDALRVDWPTRPQRNPMPNQAVVQSDTWLHVSEGQVAADCQIRINGAKSLPKQLHVILDAGWEPVGTEWNDFKLISNEPTPGGNRRSYLVSRESLSDRAVIRVLTVPRNGETAPTLAVPFFALAEAPSTGRTLAISIAGKSRWKLTGSEFWNRLNQTGVDLEWDPGKPALTDLWRVPSGAMSGLLQRLASEVATVDEASELQLISTKTTLNYRATWSQPTDTQVVKLEVPPDAEPRSVRVNGANAEYQLHVHDGRRYMLVNVARVPTEIRLLEIQMQLGRNSTEATNLPRIVLKEASVSRSVYQVNCGAELVCTLSDPENSEPQKNEPQKNESENRLKLTKPVVDQSAMLSSLTVPVGVVDLANGYRDSVHLPVKYKVEKRPAANFAANAMALTRTEQGWRASVEVLLAAEQSTEFVFFDIPTTIRDAIELNSSPNRVLSSGAAGRSTLCVIPQATDNGMLQVKFAFRLPVLGSSQSLSIPDLFLLGKEVSRPLLALPKQIDEQPVRWLRIGRRLPDDWLSKSGLSLPTDDFVYFEMSEGQQQATWRLSEAESNPAEVLFACAVLDEDSEGNTIGAINYWVDPKNHLDIALNLPKTAQLIGIQSGTSGAVWHTGKADSVRILLQPNYLPVQLRVLLRWPKQSQVPGALGTFSIDLPVLEADGMKQMPIAILSKAKLKIAKLEQKQMQVPQENFREQMAATQVDAMLADRWSKLLLKSLPVVFDLRADEFVGWMRNWSPEVIGLQRPQSLQVNGNSGESDRDTVGGFWNWYIEQTTMTKGELQGMDFNEDSLDDTLTEMPMEKIPPSVLLSVDSSKPAPSSMSILPHQNAVWYLVDWVNEDTNKLALTFSNEQQSPAAAPLAVASVLFCAASGLLYLLIRRLRNRTNEVLAMHAWLYWAFLAVLAWLLLPVAGPSILIAINSIGMLLGQFMSSRRRNLALRR